MTIACPQCGWKFRHQVKWICDECRKPFYTFDHHGVCPACGHVHEVTICPRCRVFSMHEHWYRDDDDDKTWGERILRIPKSKKKKKRSQDNPQP